MATIIIRDRPPRRDWAALGRHVADVLAACEALDDAGPYLDALAGLRGVCEEEILYFAAGGSGEAPRRQPGGAGGAE